MLAKKILSSLDQRFFFYKHEEHRTCSIQRWCNTL